MSSWAMVEALLDVASAAPSEQVEGRPLTDEVESKTLASLLAHSSHNFSHRNLSTFDLKRTFSGAKVGYGKDGLGESDKEADLRL